MHRNSVVLLAGCVLALFCARLAAQQEVIVYGANTPEWNKKLGTTATRGACSLAVDECLKRVDDALNSQHTSRYYLNLAGDMPQIAREAAQYSEKSRSHAGLYELGIDDFYGKFNKWCRAEGPKECEQQLGAVIRAVKSGNPKLKFGVTVYEDEVDKFVADRSIPNGFRRDIDVIHLYLHFRQNEKGLSSFVSQLKSGFPNSQIIIGLYPYDRVELAPCKQNGTSRCTAADDNAYFLNSLKTAIRMSKAGEVAGIEFYPGNFGTVEQWAGWQNPKVCSSGRQEECIRNTKTMHDAIANTIANSH